MEDDLDVPNCPRCLHSMEPVELARGPVWRCPECGAVHL
ncbi:zf-TFIIB domain-containing protein [Streptomyces scabiei]